MIPPMKFSLINHFQRVTARTQRLLNTINRKLGRPEIGPSLDRDVLATTDAMRRLNDLRLEWGRFDAASSAFGFSATELTWAPIDYDPFGIIIEWMWPTPKTPREHYVYGEGPQYVEVKSWRLGRPTLVITMDRGTYMRWWNEQFADATQQAAA
jgi:hypothetical protein